MRKICLFVSSDCKQTNVANVNILTQEAIYVCDQHLAILEANSSLIYDYIYFQQHSIKI